MTRICFLIRMLNEGGAQRQLLALIKGLDPQKYDLCLMTFYDGGLFGDEIRKLKHVKYVSLNKRGRWDVIRFLGRLVKEMRRFKPDLVQGYLGTANCLTVLLKPFLPKTRMVWGLRASNMDLSFYDRISHYHHKLECWLSRFADSIIVNSKAGYQHAASEGFPADKMIVIPNGIDLHQFKPDAAAGMRIRKEWNIAEKDKLIGLVGRLDPMKDHTTFLKAAALLLKKRSDVRFVSIGNGPESYKASLMQIADELQLKDHMLWAGSRKDMPAVYNALDIVCSSSSFGEGFPNVIGEAMACGVPCVVTDVGDSSWLVGDSGVVVPPRDPQALAAGWETCMSQPHAETTVQARARIENNFSVEQLVARTEAVLCPTP